MVKDFFANKSGKLSNILLEELGIGYFSMQKILRKKDVKLNGKRVSSDLLVSVGDKIEVYYFNSETKSLYVQIYEDENVLVVNKKTNVLSEVLFEKLKEEKGELYFIHRLDRNTQGIMIFAKNKIANEELLKGFKNRTFEKYYLALVYGHPKKEKDILQAYLKKDKETGFSKVFSTKVEGSVKIITEYLIKEKQEEVIQGKSIKTALLEVKLHTGKTHQIRAHFAHVGHFVIGDGKYGMGEINRLLKKDKQELKSYKLILHFKNEERLYYLNNKIFEI